MCLKFGVPVTFQFLIEELPNTGSLVIHESTLPYLDIKKCQAKIYTYGASSSCDARYKIEKMTENFTVASFQIEGVKEEMRNLEIPLFGTYNMENALAVTTLALGEGLTPDEVRGGLKSFQGTRERQELLGIRSDKTIVIRDYAHHPTAVTLTLGALRQRFPSRRFIAIFEPRSASSKRKVFEERYGESFKDSDVSIIISPETKLANSSEEIDIENIKKIINSHNREAHTTKNFEETLNLLLSITKPEDVVIFMSSGDLQGIPTKFVEL